MREKLKNPEWKRPKGYTWNHAGDGNCKVMELVKSKPGYKHGAVAHRGSAALPRSGVRVPGFAALAAYMAIRDIAELTGDTYDEVFAPAYFYDSVDGSVFWVDSGNWIYSPRIHYVGGPRNGQDKIISTEDYAYYNDIYESKYGRYVSGGLFGKPKFIPGTERTALPMMGRDGRTGYIDKSGPHWDSLPCGRPPDA